MAGQIPVGGCAPKLFQWANMRWRAVILSIVILSIVLFVAWDLTLNDASGLKALVAYTNVLMWKIGPI